MQLYPQDLRDSYHWETVLLRANYGSGATADTRALLTVQPQVRKHVGLLGKLWLGKLPLTRDQAETALPAAAMSTQGVAWLSQVLLTGMSGLVGAILHKNGVLSTPEAWGMMALTGGALFYPSFVLWPRAALKSLYGKPLTINEVDGLAGRAQSELERDYLALVREAIRQPVPEAAEADVRAAIRALGEAVDALPSIESEPVDTQALRTTADMLRVQARDEQDRIIADSQENRADALERRADAADRSAQYARRINALQEEIAAQIAATRQDLTAFHADGGGAAADSTARSHLADAGRRIATVAVSAARARAELDAAVPPQTPRNTVATTEDWRAVASEPAEVGSAQFIRAGIK